METTGCKQVKVMVKQNRSRDFRACFAVGGGITWFFHQYLFSSILWAIAGIIILKLNKMKNRSKKDSRLPPCF